MKVSNLFFGIACLLVSTVQAEVLLVRGPNPDFTEIADAVQAAQDGDVLLVWNGTYGDVVVANKSLVIEPAEANSSINILWSLSVQNLDDDQTVAIRGLDVWEITIKDCAGSVRLEDCNQSGSNSRTPRFTHSDDVAVVGGTFMPLTSGSRGLVVWDTTLAAFDLTALGRDGGQALGGGYPGGHGIELDSSAQVFWSGGTGLGGDGGNGASGLSGGPCDRGGDGVFSPVAANFQYKDAAFVEGQGGTWGTWVCSAGTAVNSGTLLPGQRKAMTNSPLIFDNAEIGLTFQGSPGDLVSYCVSEATDRAQGPEVGPTLVSSPLWISAGAIPSTGVLHVTHNIQGLPMLSHTTLHVQGRMDDGNAIHMTNPGWATVLDRGLDFCNVLETRVGQVYCAPNTPNSTGTPARILAVGSHCVVNNELTIHALGLPHNQFGYLLNSPGQGFIPNPGGSMGNLCLGGGHPIGRHNAASDIRNSGFSGSFEVPVDLTQVPSLPNSSTIMPGQGWHFQVWYRDGASSNFTSAVQVVFH